MVLTRRALSALGLLVLAVGCRSASERFLELAAGRNLRSEVVRGTGFHHLVLSSVAGGDRPDAARLPRRRWGALARRLPRRRSDAARPARAGPAGARSLARALPRAAVLSRRSVTSPPAQPAPVDVRALLRGRGGEPGGGGWSCARGTGCRAHRLARLQRRRGAGRAARRAGARDHGVITVAANLDIDAWADGLPARRAWPGRSIPRASRRCRPTFTSATTPGGAIARCRSRRRRRPPASWWCRSTTIAAAGRGCGRRCWPTSSGWSGRGGTEPAVAQKGKRSPTATEWLLRSL